MCKTFQEYEKNNALKPHEKYDDHDSSPPESRYYKDDNGDEDSDAVYAKMSRLVSDHSRNAEEDKLEDPNLVWEEN